MIYLAEASATATLSSAIVQLGNGDGSFREPVSYTVGNGAQSLLVADFNGDGKQDLASANTNDNTVSVLLGNGDGTFQAGTVFPVLNAPEVLAIGDFNGDGKQDLVVGYRYEDAGDVGGISVLLGNGDGTFTQHVDYEAKTTVFDMLVGDFNQDGKLDLILAGNFGSGIGIEFLQGNGDGTFRAAVSIPSDGNLESLAAADLNGDGKLDLITSDYQLDFAGGGAFVLLGNGDGTFQSPKQYGPGRTSIGLAVADFNADGKLDVAISNQDANSFSILLGNGDGTLQNPIDFPIGSSPLSIVAWDFNGDGKVDLAAITAVATGPFAAQIFLQGAFPVSSLSPTSLTFSQQSVGSTSPPQVVTLTNTGAAALALTSVGITGPNAGDFAQTNNCGSTLAPTAGCQISVTFAPIAPVNAVASLNLTDNAPGSPQAIALAGSTPAVAVAALSPKTIAFPNQYVGTSGLPQTVTLNNTGTAALAITSVTASPSDFGVLNSCGNSVAPGSSCAIGVFFDPAASGARTGTMTITDNAADSPQTVTLSGTGQDFSVASSGSPTATVTAGQTANYTLAVSPGGGFNQTVAFTCGGAPALSVCTVSPSSFSLNGASAASVTATITTTMHGFLLPIGVGTIRVGTERIVGFCLSVGLAALIWVLRWRHKQRFIWIQAIAAVILFSIGVTLTSCGGGGGSPGTPAGTYTISVSGSFSSGSTTLTHGTNLTLVVK